MDLRSALDSGRRACNKLHPKLIQHFESKGFIESFVIPRGRSAKTDPVTLEHENAEPGEGLSAAV